MLSVLNKVHFFDPQTKTWLPVNIPVQPNKIKSIHDTEEEMPQESIKLNQCSKEHGITMRQSWNPMNSLIPSYYEIMKQ